MFTGQIRTFKKCIENIFENLMNCNDEYNFDVYFLLDDISKSSKYKYVEVSKNLETDIMNSFHKYNKCINIKIFIQDINYPDYCSIGSYYALYKTEMLINKIKQLTDINNYDIFIRMRPDVIFSKPLYLNMLELNNKIHIINSLSKINCYCHNRDWDYMCVSDLKGMESWCKYHIFLKTFKKSFPNIIKFNNKSYWEKTTNNINVSATQQLFEYVLNNNYELIFDSGNTFLTIVR